MAQNTVKVRDENGQAHTWIIEQEKRYTYQIFLNGIMTEIYKNKCFVFNGVLYSYEIRNNNFPDYKMWFDFQEQPDTEIDYGYWESDYNSNRSVDFEYEGWNSEGQKAMYDYIKNKMEDD